MSKIILVTSHKGGVGKTTISANLALSFAQKGYKTLVVDFDLESRCLDMALGLESSSLFNICDVLKGDCSADQAQTCDLRCPELTFIAAPLYLAEDFYENEELIFENAKKFLSDMREKFDFIILDLPARPDRLYPTLAGCCDEAIVVCLHTAASIRAAEKSAMTLAQMSDENERPIGIQLVINSFMPGQVVEKVRPGIIEIISKTSVKLAGVIPYDTQIQVLQEKGMICIEQKKRSCFDIAIMNITERLLGRNVALLDGMKLGYKKDKLY